MTIYLGPFQGDGLTQETAWRGPPGCTGSFDLRSLPGHGSPGRGLFECPADPGAGYTALGDGALDTVGAVRRTALANTLGLPAFAATRLGPIVHEIAQQGDTAGQARWKPALLEPGRISRMCVGSVEIAQQVDDTDPRWLAHVSLLRAEYARVRAQAIAAPADEARPWAVDRDAHKRLLAKWTRKYWLGPTGYRQFLNGLPDEGTLPERTSFQDDFSGTLGSWTQRDGVWSISSGVLQLDTAAGYSTMIHVSSWAGGADYYAQGKVTTWKDPWAVALRRVNYTGTESDWYQCAAFASSQWYIFKRVSASWTLVRNDSQGITAGDVLRARCAGSTLSYYRNGSQVGSNSTDTSLSAAGTPGLHSQASGAQFDDYLLDDEAAAATTSRLALLGVG